MCIANNYNEQQNSKLKIYHYSRINEDINQSKLSWKFIHHCKQSAENFDIKKKIVKTTHQ